MKIALIGLGQQTQSEILPALLETTDLYTVVALCDKDKAHLQLLQTFFPNAQGYSDYKELIKNETDIEAVIVSLPHYLYLEVVKEAAELHVNVLKEKPLAKNLKESTDIYALALKNNIKVYTITKRNFYKTYNRAKELFPRLGQIYQYTAKHFVTGGNIHQGWKSNFKEAGGGVVINLAYHFLDILINYFGEIKTAEMISSNLGSGIHQYEVEDSASALLLHTTNVYGSFQFNCYSGVKQEAIEINGTEGTLVVTKNDVYLYSIGGEILIHESFNQNSQRLVQASLRSFHELKAEDAIIHLTHHTQIMKAIDMLYKNNIFIQQ